MAPVRPELMSVVYSQLTDEEAAARIGELVRTNRQAAEATLRYVRGVHDFSRGYDTDRAYRVLVAAMNETGPAPVRREDAELFDRERELGWMPLADSFDRLCSTVPELEGIRRRAEELAAAPESFGIVHDTERNELVIPSGLLPNANGLVGRDSRHPDALIRSSVAASVAAAYVTAVLTHTTDRPLWERSQRVTTVRVTGSFF